jgi:hypothetical protein
MPTRYIPVKRTKGHTINPIRMPPSARNLFGEPFSAPRNEMNPRMIANILAAIEKNQEYIRNPIPSSKLVHPVQSIIAQEILKWSLDIGITPNIAMTANTRLAIANPRLVFEKKGFSELEILASLVLQQYQYTEIIIGNQSLKI